MSETNSENSGGDQPQQQQQQQQEQPWHAELPDDLKGNASITKYASLEDAARGLVHYSGHFGVPDNQLLRLPKPDDAEGMGQLWNKLGRPESPDKYEGVTLPDGSPLDKEALSGFLATMHKSGPFTPAMAKAAVDWYSGLAAQQTQAIADQIKTEGEAATTALKQEWGDSYKPRFDAAMQAAAQFGGEELAKYVDETGLGNDPRFIKAWDKVAEAMREAGPPPDNRGNTGNRPLSPAEAEAELTRFQSDPEISKALMDANHPNHEHFVAKRLELIKARRPAAQ